MSIADCIQRGDVERLQRCLEADPPLADEPVHWFLNQPNRSDPLHFVADCVFHGWLTNGTEAALTALLLDHGARVDGSPGSETPLIGAASLLAEAMVPVLIAAGADLEATSVFGARALHWAARLGSPTVVHQLLTAGASVDPRCRQWGATPLYWAVHALGPNGGIEVRGQLEAARLLLDAGADPDTQNHDGTSLAALSAACGGVVQACIERALAARDR